MLKKIFNAFQRVVLGYETDVLTFSQAGEDLIVRNFFYERLSNGKNGFYVDIGAYHPYRHSNTYYLYRGGWSGINIDARPGSMKLFDKLRPRDINLEVAVSDNNGITMYYDFGEHAGLNTISTDYIEKLGTTDAIKRQYEVKTATLEHILSSHLPINRSLDFMSIDVEGVEEKVLTSNNWELFRPHLIACELYGNSLNELMKDPVTKLLQGYDYTVFARVNLTMPNVNTVFFVNERN